MAAWGFRWFDGRPLWARFGKRSLVIVDTPCNHQLLEAFVSKLFSLSYGFVSIDVHGACGIDHFVHRFTHRVVRGSLVAIGRTDGRLCCLAKSEAATLLSAKQAVFIQNPAYTATTTLATSFTGLVSRLFGNKNKGDIHCGGIGRGSGPDIVTLGHNPYSPNLGSVVSNIVLPSHTRSIFVDEVLYERLHGAELVFSAHILRSISQCSVYYDEFKQHKSNDREVQEVLKYGRNILGK